MATISRLSVSLTANTKKFKKAMAGARNTLKGFVKGVFSVKGALVTLVGAAGIGLAIKNIITVNTKFQILRASLKTMTGSTKAAAKAFDLIRNFAKTTPFDLDQVISAFIKLKALGLDPSTDALTSYGNTAAAMGKGLNQMIEAVADAVTGEFERLKEFGIKTKSEGDKVTFTFQGISTTVGKNAKEIEGFLQTIGNNQFGTAMSDQMGLLAPSFSNLGDAWDAIKLSIGEAGLNDLVVNLTDSVTAFLTGISTDTIKKFTQFIIGMGFSLALSVLDMVEWVTKFISGTETLETAWLKLQIGVINFGLQSIKIFRVIGDAFLEMNRTFLDSVMSQPEFMGALIPDELPLGLHLAIEGAKELDSILAGASGSLSRIGGGLKGDLATAQSRVRTGDSISDKIIGFVDTSRDFVKTLDMKVKGEDEVKQLVLGADPTQNSINKGIQRIGDILIGTEGGTRGFGAIAG